MKFKAHNRIIPNVPMDEDGVIVTNERELINALRKMEGVEELHERRNTTEDDEE
jgi:hypothetical protein